MEFNTLLQKITDIVLTYESGAFKDLHVMNRELRCYLFRLSEYQIEFKNKYIKCYYNSKEKTNAAKERECELKVPELYACRKISETAKAVSLGMSQEIKLN